MVYKYYYTELIVHVCLGMIWLVNHLMEKADMVQIMMDCGEFHIQHEK